MSDLWQCRVKYYESIWCNNSRFYIQLLCGFFDKEEAIAPPRLLTEKKAEIVPSKTWDQGFWFYSEFWGYDDGFWFLRIGFQFILWVQLWIWERLSAIESVLSTGLLTNLIGMGLTRLLSSAKQWNSNI